MDAFYVPQRDIFILFGEIITNNNFLLYPVITGADQSFINKYTLRYHVVYKISS